MTYAVSKHGRKSMLIILLNQLNVLAAHEQPIISLSEVVLYNTKDLEHAKLLEVINRNAKRLRRLTEDILDVTYIFLKKEQFNLNDVITDAIDDIITNKISRKTESDNNNNNAIKLLYEPQVLSYKLQSEAHKQPKHWVCTGYDKYKQDGYYTQDHHIKKG